VLRVSVAAGGPGVFVRGGVGVHAFSLTGVALAENREIPWSDPERIPDPSGMSLMATGAAPWDHRGITESPDPAAPTHPLLGRGGPSEPPREHPGAPDSPPGQPPAGAVFRTGPGPAATTPGPAATTTGSAATTTGSAATTTGPAAATGTGPSPRRNDGSVNRSAAPGAGWSWPDGGWSHHDGSWSGRRMSHRHHVGGKFRSLRRTPDNRVLGGVCGGVSRATGIDATWVRIGFVLIALMSGVMVFVYAMAWLLIPMEGMGESISSRAMADKRGIRLVAAVVIPLAIAMSVITSTLHIAVVGWIGWPTFLAAGVVVLIWRNADESERAFIDADVVPLLGGTVHGKGRRWLYARIALGVLVGAGGIVLLVEGHTTVAALRPVGGAALVVAASVIIFGPWWLSLVRDLIAERQARALAEERAQMAAHVHDSVLQTLALIQRSADDPQNVVRLARAQERELRAWLFEGKPPGAIGGEATMLAEGVGLLQRQVEADHGIAVQVVMVGDCELDEALRALLDAAREATVNAAKWSGADQVSLYAEVEADTVMLYVRDRGCGFDPDAVPADRQGIAQSIRARIARFGGTAVVRSAPGEGAEVQLSMPRRERVR
jgi:signal transduction histidine kinase